MRRLPLLLWTCVFLLSAAPSWAQFTTELKPETVAAFQKYQANVDQELNLQIQGKRPYLWVDQRSDLAQKAKGGEVVTYAFTGKNGLSVPGGLIHDWVGVIYLKGAHLDAVRDFLLDTPKHARAYAEVKSAKQLSRNDNHSVTELRIVKKKILTAVLDIQYENTWQSPSPDKWAYRVRSSKVLEIQDAGTPEERAYPVDRGHGFLWRMNSDWLLRQDAGGVWAELRVVSLSRDTPRMLSWAIKPMIRDFPAEGITSTLRQTQTALQH
jgi:hypothetical protein